MKAYITAADGIFPVPSFEDLDKVQRTDRSFRCCEPDYKPYIDPMSLRRMNRVVRMAIAAAKNALAAAGAAPDAIAVGTGMGCLEYTEKFLVNMVENDEKFPNPSFFINSTHNTIASQVAINLKCKAANTTYTQGSLSFESALREALLLLNEGEARTVLAGGTDECTDEFYAVLRRLGAWKRPGGAKGTVPGEGAAFFCISSEASEKALAELKAVRCLNECRETAAAKEALSLTLAEAGCAPEDIDLVMTGSNGDIRFDGVYDGIREGALSAKPSYAFKELCGEYATASSFALWLAVRMFAAGKLPDGIGTAGGRLRNVLIVNRGYGNKYSFMVAGTCRG